MITEEHKQDMEKKSETSESSTNANSQPQPAPTEQVDYKELSQRLTADLQNYKRRVEKERSEWIVTAQANLIGSLTPIFDDLDRAIEAATKNTGQSLQSIQEGLLLVQKNMQKILSSIGVEEIKSYGEFNPEFHEALMHAPSSDHKSGEIVQILSKGYLFKGKVIRHAKVSVAE